MYSVYILRDSASRHYFGMTADLTARLQQHRSGGTQTTRRMQGELTLVIHRDFPSQREALLMERKLKSWKNPTKAISFLSTLAG